MAKFIRMSQESLDLLWQAAQHKHLVFESPGRVLRAMVLHEQREPRKGSVQIRVDDEVWAEIQKTVARRAVDTRRQVRNTDNLIQMLYEDESKQWFAAGLSPVGRPLAHGGR